MQELAGRNDRGKYWVFTLNNYSEEEETLLSNVVEDANPIQFLSYGRELGEQGTPHLQGQLECDRRMTRRAVNRLLGNRCWLAVRRGSFEQAKEYCEKDGDFVVYGERVSEGRGKRTDLDNLKADLNDGKSLQEISNEHFGSFLRYRRAIVAWKNLNTEARAWQCSVIVYWGRTGAGKTKTVYDNVSDFSEVYAHPGGQWFDGYHGQKIVLFDDFGGSEFKITYLLKLLDRYPMRVPIKGDFVQWVPHEVYITSNRSPEDWYPGANSEHVAALFRRLTNIVHFP